MNRHYFPYGAQRISRRENSPLMPMEKKLWGGLSFKGVEITSREQGLTLLMKNVLSGWLGFTGKLILFEKSFDWGGNNFSSRVFLYQKLNSTFYNFRDWRGKCSTSDSRYFLTVFFKWLQLSRDSFDTPFMWILWNLQEEDWISRQFSSRIQQNLFENKNCF